MRFSQIALNPRNERMRATEYAPRGPFQVLERRHCLAEVVERGSGVPVERHRVVPSHSKREFMTLPENASRRGHRFFQQRLAFYEALEIEKEPGVVAS